MDFNKFKEVVKDIKGIVTSQTQVRTNKLKPLAEELEHFVTYFESLPTPAPADPDQVELLRAVSGIKENYGVSTHQALQLIEEGVKNGSPDEDLTKENRYLKRKLTMYDLKIAKYENEIKDLKKKK
jgi:hypothetical protein